MKKNSLLYKIRIYLTYLFIPIIITSSLFYYFALAFVKEEINISLNNKSNLYYQKDYNEYIKKIENNFEYIYEKARNVILEKEEIDPNDFTFLNFNEEILNFYYGGSDGSLFYLPKKNVRPVLDPRNSDWYKNTKLGNQITYTETYKNPFNTTNTIILSKTIIDNNEKLLGVIAIGLSIDKLIDNLNNIGPSNINNYLLTDNNKEIVFNDHVDLGTMVGEVEVKKLPNVQVIKRKFYLQFPLDTFSLNLIGEISGDIFNTYKERILKKVVITLTIGTLLYTIISIIILKKLEYEDKLIKDLVSKVTGKTEGSMEENTNLEQLYSEVERVLESYKNVKREAFIDPLTKIYNRNFLNKHLEDIVKRHEKATLLLFDLDKFKQVNDNLGHDVGDGVLKRIGSTLRGLIGQNDIPVRYGGDEFLVVFLDSELVDSYKVAEAFRQKIENLNWREKGIEVTVSGGLVEFKKGLEKSMVEADKLLYEAKKNGRNQIVIDI